MSNKPQEFKWDECLDEPSQSVPVPTDMVNQTYRDNLPAVRKAIEQDCQRNAVACEQIKKLIIR